MVQHGFFIDLSRCIGCNACVIACKQWHDIPPGSVKWLRIHQWETGCFPDVRIHIQPIMCFHCQNPVCVAACPHGAIYKEEEFGAVLVDAERCCGERKCLKACPYGAPQFGTDQPGEIMSKCNMCYDRLNEAKQPICILSCPMRALEFGPLEELGRLFGTIRTLDYLPKSSITSPSVIFRETASKRSIVPWDPQKALSLWATRTSSSGESLPPVFEDIKEVTDAPRHIIGRPRLVLKPHDAQDLLRQTTDDE